MIGNAAVVRKVLPGKGLLVAYRDGITSGLTAGPKGDPHFVYVGSRRASPFGGSETDWPEVGELGLVVDVYPGFSVWICSLPWEESNQQDLRPGVRAWRHSSGLQVVATQEGDFQFCHPSGLTLTVSRDGEPLAEIQGNVPLDRLGRADGSVKPHLRLWHPSGFEAHVDPEGAVEVLCPSTVSLDAQGDVTVAAAKKATVTVGGDLVATVSGKANATVQGDLGASVAGKATVSVSGDLSATVGGNATLKAAKIVLDGPVECTQGLTVAQDVVAQGKVQGATVKNAAGLDLAAHKHSGVTTGTGISGPAQA